MVLLKYFFLFSLQKHLSYQHSIVVNVFDLHAYNSDPVLYQGIDDILTNVEKYEVEYLEQ